MNMYQWEARTAKKFEAYGNGTLTLLLLLAAAMIILIALFSRSILLKSLVLAYVILP